RGCKCVEHPPGELRVAIRVADGDDTGPRHLFDLELVFQVSHRARQPLLGASLFLSVHEVRLQRDLLEHATALQNADLRADIRLEHGVSHGRPRRRLEPTPPHPHPAPPHAHPPPPPDPAHPPPPHPHTHPHP